MGAGEEGCGGWNHRMSRPLREIGGQHKYEASNNWSWTWTYNLVKYMMIRGGRSWRDKAERACGCLVAWRGGK